MLNRIFIQNFALIDQLEIHLQKGLQVITGETGAGKSIILGALRLIMGVRADLKNFADLESKSIVETEFKISKNLIISQNFVGVEFGFGQNVRKLKIVKTPFSMIYRIKKDRIEVLRVLDERTLKN